MDWNDLPVDPKALDRLRREFAVARPEEVVRLAWGAEDLLGRVLDADDIFRIRDRFAIASSLPYDSAGFKLGARPGSPAHVPAIAPLPASDGFIEKRTSLLEKLERATTPARRTSLESQLEKLYSGG